MHNYGCAMGIRQGIPQEVADSVRSIVERTVWATLTTVGRDGRPRNRLVHPVWWWDGEGRGLVTSRATPLRVRHLAANPYVSCFYWAPHHDTVAIDATARWLPDEELVAAWESIAAVPEPVGFDPATIWPDGPSSSDFHVLEMRPHRILARPVGGAPLRWQPS